MTSRKVTRPKINKDRLENWHPMPLDKAIFHELYFALRVILLNGNNSATARVLGIDRRTADAWVTRPPKSAPHINATLRHILKELIKYAQHHKTRQFRDRAREALDHINRYATPRSFTSDGTEHVEDDIDTGGSCARALLEYVTRGPISTAELRKGRYSVYSLRAYRSAAERLMLDKKTIGYGDDKTTWYALPGDLPVVSRDTA